MSKEKKEEIIEWNDKILGEISCSKKFPKEVVKIQEIQPIIFRFFDFYFSGKVSSDCTVQCTLFSPIALLNVQNSNNDYLQVFSGTKFVTDGNEQSFYDTHQHTNTKQNWQDHCQVKSQNLFQNEIWNCLKSWNRATIHEQKTLMRLSAFLALKLCSVASKNNHQMAAIFDAKLLLRKNLSNLVGWELNRQYSGPHVNAFDLCREILVGDLSLNSPLKSLYAIVVQTWINDRISSKENKISSLLMNSLLEDTAGNGIGLITMMTSVMYCMNVTYEQVLNALKAETIFSQYEASWNRLAEFKRKFVDKARPELSYPWGRIIRPTSLSEYSAKNNVFLCGILAAIVAIYDGPQVWNANWAINNISNLQEAKKVAVKIHNRLMKNS